MIIIRRRVNLQRRGYEPEGSAFGWTVGWARASLMHRLLRDIPAQGLSTALFGSAFAPGPASYRRESCVGVGTGTSQQLLRLVPVLIQNGRKEPI